MQRTTIALSPSVRDRLQAYGRKGMTYEEILVGLMEAVDPASFALAAPQTHRLRMTAEETREWRTRSAEKRLEFAEGYRNLAYELNRKGTEAALASRKQLYR